MAIILFIISSIVQLAFLYIGGVHMGGDSHFYMQSAFFLKESHFSFSELLASGHPLYYVAYPTFLALLGNNPILVVFIQILLQAFASILIYRIGTIIHSKASGILAGIIYALCFEIFQWSTYILTDSLFLFLIVVGIYAYIKKAPTLFWIVAGTMVFLRPTAAPFLLAAAIAHTWHIKKITRLIIYSVLIVAIIVSVVTILSQDAGPRLGISGYVHYFASLFERGVLVRDRPSLMVPVEWTSAQSVENITTFAHILLLRLLLFWAPAISDFSLPHVLVNIATLIPIYVFGIIGISKYAKRFILGIAIIVVFWVFQSFTELDYDWRYRTPALIPLILFAGMGMVTSFKPGIHLLQEVARIQIMRFVFFGAVSTAVDYAVLNSLHLAFGVSLFWSVFWAFVCGGVVGYVLHSRFTFQYDATNKHPQKLSQYLLLCLANLALTEAVMHSMAVQAGVPYNVAKLIAILLVAIVSFTVNKFILFKNPTSVTG